MTLHNSYLRLAIGLLVVVVVAAVRIWPFESLPVLYVALQALVFVALAAGYVRTRNGGLAWLGVAIFIWPLAWDLLTHAFIRPGIDQASMGETAGTFPFTLVSSGQMTLGSFLAALSYVQLIGGQVLMLVAVLKLAASREQRGGGEGRSDPENSRALAGTC